MVCLLHNAEKAYRFTGPEGPLSLADLFGRHSQLIVYHFMFAPEWEAGCKSCSCWADTFDRLPPHLAAQDIAFWAVSRAPIDKLTTYAARMGWTFPWCSADGGEFAYDYAASFREADLAAGHGLWNFRDQPLAGSDAAAVSVFVCSEDGAIHRTYSCHQRGVEAVNGAHGFIDLTPLGRQEPAEGNPQAWVRRRDEYLR